MKGIVTKESQTTGPQPKNGWLKHTTFTLEDPHLQWRCEKVSFGYFLHMMFETIWKVRRWLATPNFGDEKRLSRDMINQYMGVEASFQVGNFQDAPPGLRQTST